MHLSRQLHRFRSDNRKTFRAEALELRCLLSNAMPTTQDATGVSSVLLQLVPTGEPSTSTAVSGGDFSVPNDLVFNGSGDVGVQITAQNVGALTKPLAALGFQADGVDAADHLLDGFLPIGSIDSVGGLSSIGLMGVLPEYQPQASAGAVDSQGDAVLEADRACAATGDNGAGITVGVLSDSYNDLGTASADVASGDLPGNVNVLQDLPSGGTDEGRAMLQIVHDLAPGANLAFATADISEAQFAANIVRLATPINQGGAGANIIADDVNYYDEPYYQDGIVAQAIDNVVTNYNVAYFSAAGNYSDQAYESTNVNFITDRIPGISPHSASYYNFDPTGSPDDRQTLTLESGQSVLLGLQWDDPFYTTNGVTTDLNFFALNASNGQVIASSTMNTIANQTPYQFLSVQYSGSGSAQIEVVIQKVSGPTPGRLKYVNFGSNEYGDVTFDDFATDSPTINPHAGAADAMAVAAASASDQRNPEPFTGVGPTTILFDASGNRLASPVVRAKPDITATDGVSTTFFGRDMAGYAEPQFFGTSAATPHAAAIAALILEEHPTWTPFQIYADLQSTADPNIGGVPGNPNVVGAGLIDAYRAMVGGLVASATPVSDDFTDSALAQDWQVYTSGSGRADLYSPTPGSNELVLDSNVNDDIAGSVLAVGELSEAILHLDLTATTGVMLQFDEQPFANSFQTNQPMPASFVGHGNYDGVALSVDGVNWYLITPLSGANTESAVTAYSFDISAIAAADGLALTADTQIKFQHYDPDSLSAPNGGFAFSNVQVTAATAPLTLDGPAFYLQLDADQAHLDIWNSDSNAGAANQSVLLSTISVLSVTSTAPGSSLTIDFSAGDPLIPSGLSYNPGGSGINTLTMVGDSGNDNVTVGASSATFGAIPINFSNVGLVSFSGGTGASTLTQTANPGGSGSVGFTNMTLADALNVNGGNFTFPPAVAPGINALSLGSLSIAAGASATIADAAAQAGQTVLILNSLSIAGAPAHGWASSI